VLSGVTFQKGQQWLAVIVDALARRHGRPADDERCSLAARVGLGALAAAVDRWIADGCRGDLSAYIETSFDRMADVCGELSRPKQLTTITR
jgi:hypothetical protein